MKQLLFDACKQELANIEHTCAEMHRDVYAKTQMPHKLIATTFLRSTFLCLMHQFRNEKDPVAAIRDCIAADINRILAGVKIKRTIEEINRLYKEMDKQ